MPAAISYRERLQVVLVRPRNRLNIGARAMSNFGVRHLSLVNPYGVAFREVPSAVGAAAVLTDSFFDLVARGDTWSERREMRRHEMDDDEREMARRCFGYGCWNAPYWFIGQEQGMTHEENDDLRIRLEAWRHFDSRELDDACAFHLRNLRSTQV